MDPSTLLYVQLLSRLIEYYRVNHSWAVWGQVVTQKALQHDASLKQVAALTREKTTLIVRRDKLQMEKGAWAAEKRELVREKNALTTKRDKLLADKNTLLAEKKELVKAGKWADDAVTMLTEMTEVTEK